MSSAVAHALPPSILALFAPRAPLVYKPPISKNAPFSTKRPKLKCVALRLNSGPATHRTVEPLSVALVLPGTALTQAAVPAPPVPP